MLRNSGLNKDTKLFLAEWDNWKKETLRDLAPAPKNPTDFTSEEEDQPSSEMESKVSQTEDNATPKNPTDMTSEEEDKPSSSMESGNKVAEGEDE